MNNHSFGLFNIEIWTASHIHNEERWNCLIQCIEQTKTFHVIHRIGLSIEDDLIKKVSILDVLKKYPHIRIYYKQTKTRQFNHILNIYKSVQWDKNSIIWKTMYILFVDDDDLIIYNPIHYLYERFQEVPVCSVGYQKSDNGIHLTDFSGLFIRGDYFNSFWSFLIKQPLLSKELFAIMDVTMQLYCGIHENKFIQNQLTETLDWWVIRKMWETNNTNNHHAWNYQSDEMERSTFLNDIICVLNDIKLDKEDDKGDDKVDQTCY